MTETEAKALLPDRLVARYRQWHRGGFQRNRAGFARLMAEGQHPSAMVISCCDSRIDVLQIFGAEPGDLFVVRNVANLVPPYRPDHQHHGTSAAVEYAVTILGVSHILVIGHSQCGGVAACHKLCTGAAPELETPASFIGRWVEILRPGAEAVLARGVDPHLLGTELEHEAVRTSLRNLRGFPFVAEAERAGRLVLHGGWMDIASGVLFALDEDDRFRPV
ncbi:MAG: carbonic anhydrase [Pseudomonadota bacterium]